MRLLIFIFAFLVTARVFSQQPATIKLKDLKEILEAKSEKIQVINFWATWCAPCVKEMPFFEKLTAEQRPEVKVLLVSMDLELDPDPQKVYKFVTRKNLHSEVALLDAKNPNEWINSIEKEWSGALPATIIINQKTGQRKFVGKELHEGELEKLIAELQ